ncbi:AAA family ATPase [candidate division WWE3 bacterium]|uniref:AAA family ATPase n=1 Tax=candidate division WWE3 bacterium TaxID=2053526 RepID=A0A955RX58_UNCKA|nr:AAA family ATPase [candidate division WWE3 bacterium]
MQKSAIIEFSVENWGPFKDKAVFSMSARKSDGHTFCSNGENLLKTSLIFGPNASGKSSLLDALYVMKQAIIYSANTTENGEEAKRIVHRPFLGSRSSIEQPTKYEIIFSVENPQEKDNGVYKYSFSVLQDAVTEEILAEINTKGTEKLLIERTVDKVETSDEFREVSNFIKNQSDLRKDTLFLSFLAQLNNNFAVTILDFFRNVNVISGIHNFYVNYTIKKFQEDESFRKKVLEYLREADFCIKDAEVRTTEADDSTGKMRKFLNIFFSHPVFGKDNKEVHNFELPLESESDGTNSFFQILGPILDTLEKGKILFIDELDNSLHPLLTRFIVDLFDSEVVNVNNAQLVATTHDTSLLSNKRMIKDQFWFTEKDNYGSAKLFSLAEFAGSDLRNDSEYSKKYLEGRFGALPVVGMITD